MSELVCITLDGVRYAVRAARVLSRERVGSLHRLPFADPRGGVLAMIGERPETFADLPACLGHSPTRGTGPVHALVISQEPPVRGFIAGGELVEVAGPDDALIPVPQCLPGGPFEGFFVHDAFPVPVIDIAALYARVREGTWTAPRCDLLLPRVPDVSCDPSMPHRVFGTDGVLYALAGRRQWEAIRLDGVFRSPLLPPGIDGVSVTEGTAVPVFDIGRRMGGPGTADTLAVLASLGEMRIAVLIGEDRGIWEPASAVCRALPPLARPPGIAGILQRAGETALLLDLGALLSSVGALEGSGRPAPHVPSSDFPSRFGQDEIEVREVVLLGMRHALPKSEVRAVVPRISSRRVPLAPPVVVGVADYEGDLLPVLDLSAGFGADERAGNGEDMILLENGDFRAFLLSEKVLGERRVRRDDQRPVPYAAAHPFLYGCYVDGEAVRLIFNIAAIAMQFSLHPGAEARTTLAQALGLAPENLVQAAGPAEAVPQAAAPMPSVAERAPAANAPVLPEITVMPPATEGPESPAAPRSAPAEMPRGEAPLGETPHADARPAETRRAAAAGDTRPGPAAPVRAEGAPEIPPKTAEAPAAPELPSEEPQLRIPESAARSPESTPRGPAGAPTRPSRAGDARPGRLPARRSRRGRWLAVGIAVLVAAAAAVILLVPGIRGRVPPGGAAKVEAPAAPAPAAPAAPAPTKPAPAPAPAKPAPPPPAPVPAQPVEYVVTEGDTLWSIAARFTGDPHEFRRLAADNGIADPDRIYPGQKIRLTGKKQ